MRYCDIWEFEARLRRLGPNASCLYVGRYAADNAAAAISASALAAMSEDLAP